MKFVEVDPYQDRAAWLEHRRQGIGGSDIAKILGVSKWGTPWSVYVEKVVGAEDEDAGVMARLGSRMEPVILDEYQDETGFTVGLRQAMIVHPDHPWMFATVDGLVYESPDPDDESVPIKGVDAKRASSYGWDEVPLEYQAQCQWSMMVTGFDEWDLTVLHPVGPVAVHTIEADPEDQAALLRIATEFWHDHVVAGVPPPVSADDNHRLAAVWPTHVDSEVEVEGSLVDELVTVKAQQKVLETRRDDLESRLKVALGDVAVGLVGGEKAISWKTQTGGAKRFDEEAFRAAEAFSVHRFEVERTVTELDLAAIKKEEPELYAKYDQTVRVFRTHKRKGSKDD